MSNRLLSQSDSEEKCWWYFSTTKKILCYHDDKETMPWSGRHRGWNSLNIKNPRNWYYGTRKEAELLAKYADNQCFNCIEDAVGLTTVFNIPRPICGGHAIQPDVMYPSHWLKEKPKDDMPGKNDIGQSGEGVDTGSLRAFKRSVDPLPTPDVGCHAEPAAPASLTQDPKHFRGHLKGCHWSGYSNYNACSCYKVIDVGEIQNNGDIIGHTALSDKEVYFQYKIEQPDYSEHFWSEYD